MRVTGASEREPQEGKGRLAFSLCLRHWGQQPTRAHSRCLTNTSRVTNMCSASCDSSELDKQQDPPANESGGMRSGLSNEQPPPNSEAY